MSNGQEAAEYMTCGFGTEWGCKRMTEYPVVILLNGREPIPIKGHTDDRTVLFHKHCFPKELEGKVKGAFIERWMAELKARRS